MEKRILTKNIMDIQDIIQKLVWLDQMIKYMEDDKRTEYENNINQSLFDIKNIIRTIEEEMKKHLPSFKKIESPNELEITRSIFPYYWTIKTSIEKIKYFEGMSQSNNELSK